MQEPFTIHSYTAEREFEDSLDQFKSEQDIFDSKLSVRIVPHVYPLKRKARCVQPVRGDLLMTSKSAFNVALDNVLFISTLEGCWTRDVQSVSMKRQLSWTETRDTIYHQIPRRYSHPESDTPRSFVEESRRISIQSDATSTDLARRFSSESTQSTLASSIYSVEEEKLQEDHQVCETSKEQIPVWADPVKIKENPTRYEQATCYMHEANIPFDSVLPLPQPCLFYFIDNSQKNYLSSVQSLFDCDTVWNFTNRWQNYKTQVGLPSQLIPNQNLACFVQGVEPVWEDPVNKNGGRLNIHLKTNLLDSVFETLLLAFIGGSLSNLSTVGVVASKRFRSDRVELWLDESATEDKITELK
ncbi:unnamed protein product [Rhizopus stolonifer]